MDSNNLIPAKLQEIIDDFQWLEGREKVELLVQYAEQLPPIPDHLKGNAGEMEAVPECMTPVDMVSEVRDGKMMFYFNVPDESPTVRGFASLVSVGLNGSTPDQVLNVPNDFYTQMGLDQVLTSQRLNGMSAILAHMKRRAVEQIG